MSWPLVNIGRHTEKVRTWNPIASGSEDFFCYIDLSSIDKIRKTIDLKCVEEIDPVDAPSRARQLVATGDVLVATVRPNLNGVAIVPAELDGATSSTGYCVLRADEKNLHGRYLYHWVQTSSFIGYMMSKATGANYPAVSDKIIKESQIPLPPLPEQKRIAAILDKADAIRRKRQQAIQFSDDFLRAVFLDMFGDPNSNPKRADLLPMTAVFEIKTGKLNSNAATDGGKYPFFTCAKEIFTIDNFAFDQEALLLAGNNAQADYDVKYYKGKFNAYQRTYVLTLRDSGWSYAFYKFALQYQLSNLKRASKGSNTKYITLDIMDRTMLPVPSQGDQKRFVEYFDQVQAVQATLLVQAQNDEKLFSAISYKAFFGQL